MIQPNESLLCQHSWKMCDSQQHRCHYLFKHCGFIGLYLTFDSGRTKQGIVMEMGTYCVPSDFLQPPALAGLPRNVVQASQATASARTRHGRHIIGAPTILRLAHEPGRRRQQCAFGSEHSGHLSRRWAPTWWAALCTRWWVGILLSSSLPSSCWWSKYS